MEFLNSVDPNGDAADPFFNDSGGIYNFNMTMVLANSPLGLAHEGGIDFDASAGAGSKYSVKQGKENYPAVWINWNSAARFVNWLSNGQGSGETESGVYNNLSTNSSQPVPTREPGATVFLPSEDEFYKAAYYDPTKNGGAGGYWKFGVGTDSPPVSEGPAGGAASANYAIDGGEPDHARGDLFWQSGGTLFDNSIEHVTEVGAYAEAVSYYGLFDVDGLLYQWTDDGRQNVNGVAYDFPVFRGGSWSSNDEFIGAGYRNLYSFPYAASYANFGFRVASAIPTPVLTADFDDDGDVDAIDRATWGSAFGVDAGGDADDDFDTDGADFAAWQRQFTGSLSTIAAATIPEPAHATLVLCALAHALAAVRRPPRRRELVAR